MSTLIKNGRVIDPANGLDGKHDIYIVDGLIASYDTPPDGFKAAQTINATGLVVCPGLVDLCARPRLSGGDVIRSLTRELKSAVAGGVTRIICPPDTQPVIDVPATAALEQELSSDVGLTHIHPLGAMTRGLKGERLTDMAMLMDAGCVGISNGLNPIVDTLVVRRAMQYASTYDIPVFLTPFDPYLQGNGCIHEGETSTLLGLPAIPEAAETVAVARDLALIETAGVNAHFVLLSTEHSVGMIRNAKKRGLPVTASVAAHQLFLSEKDIKDFDTRYKVLPPLRSEADMSGLRAGITDGTISMVCSDHQSRGKDTKLAPFSEASFGVVGLQTLLPLTLRLVEEGVCTLTEALALLTINPAQRIGLDAGKIEVGSVADICVFDPNAEWQIDANSLLSYGVNTPLIGHTIKGLVTHTLIDGKLVYSC